MSTVVSDVKCRWPCAFSVGSFAVAWPTVPPCAGCAVQCWLGWGRTPVRSSPRNGHSTTHRCRFGFVVGRTVWWVLSLLRPLQSSYSTQSPNRRRFHRSGLSNITSFDQQLMDSPSPLEHSKIPLSDSCTATVSPVQASHPFVHIPNVGRSQAVTVPPRPLTEGGLIRLTRFIEMSLDVYCACFSCMIDTGQVEDLGCSSVLLEGCTAWRVWLRVDEWSTAPGHRARLRCGVLYQLANHTLSFHGVAVDVVWFLSPSYEAWTRYAITHLSSVRSNHPQKFLHRSECTRLSTSAESSSASSSGNQRRQRPNTGLSTTENSTHRPSRRGVECPYSSDVRRLVQCVDCEHWTMDHRELLTMSCWDRWSTSSSMCATRFSSTSQVFEKRCRLSGLKWPDNFCFSRNPVSFKYRVGLELYHIRAIFSIFCSEKVHVRFGTTRSPICFLYIFHFLVFEYLISDFWILLSFWFSLFKYMSVLENIHDFWICRCKQIISTVFTSR